MKILKYLALAALLLNAALLGSEAALGQIGANTLFQTDAPSGVAPAIRASGQDANISINMVPKGTGTLQVNGVPITAGSTFTSLTVTPGPTSLSGAVTIQPGTSTPNENLGGAVLFNSAADFTPAGTGEETAYTYTLPADALSADNQFLTVSWAATTAANANTKRARLYFGATVICDTTAGAFNAQNLIGRVTIWRTAAATQKALCDGSQTANVSWATASGGGSTISTPAETLSGPVIIKLTLLNATAAADSTARAINILWYPAGQ